MRYVGRQGAYVVWYPDGGEDGPADGVDCLGMNAEHAAERRAESFDMDEPADEGCTWELFVVPQDDQSATPVKVRVTKSLSVSYSGEVQP